MGGPVGLSIGFISHAKAMWRNGLRALHSLAVVLRAAPCVFLRRCRRAEAMGH